MQYVYTGNCLLFRYNHRHDTGRSRVTLPPAGGSFVVAFYSLRQTLCLLRTKESSVDDALWPLCKRIFGFTKTARISLRSLHSPGKYRAYSTSIKAGHNRQLHSMDSPIVRRRVVAHRMLASYIGMSWCQCMFRDVHLFTYVCTSSV